MKILGLEAQTLVHATEDREKVLAALENVFPFSFEVESVKAEGQFGNPVEILKVEVKKTEEVEDFIEHLCTALGEECRILIGDLDERFTEGRLYIRLDKGRAYQKVIGLGKGIQVEIKVTSFPYREEYIREELRKWLENVCGSQGS